LHKGPKFWLQTERYNALPAVKCHKAPGFMRVPDTNIA
jgi:hypothetical protein